MTTATTEPVTEPTPEAPDAEQEQPQEDAAELPKPAPTDDLIREHDAESRRLGELAYEAKQEWESAKKVAADLKKDYDFAAERLMDHCRRQPGYGPLFERDDETDETALAPELWRNTPLDELGITGKVAETFAEHTPPLITLGAIADWTAAGHTFDELPGIGEAKANELADKLADYWAAHPLPVEDATAPVLEWYEGEGDTIEAYSAINDDGDRFRYRIGSRANGADGYTLTGDREIVVEDSDYDTLDEAKQAAANLERAHVEAAEQDQD